MVLIIITGIFNYTPDENLLSQALKDHIEGSYLLNTTVNLEDAYTAVMIFVMIIAGLFLILVTNLVVI